MTDVDTAARTPPRSLAESLRDRTDDSLRVLLLARPDLARPVPVDMTQLASRASAPASVNRAVDSLDAFHLGVLSTVSGRHDPTDIQTVQAAVPGPAAVVARAVEVLSELALVWGPPSSLRVARAVHEALGAHPAGDATPPGPEPPQLEGPRVDQDAVDAAAAGTAFDVVRRVETLLGAWADSPPAVLRSGGLGVREVRSTASLLDVDGAQAAFLIEVVAAAGLVDRHGEPGLDEVWLPTPAASGWPERSVAGRWVDLATAWLTTPRATGLVGERDEHGRPTNALTPDLHRPHTTSTRALSLRALACARPVQPSAEAVAAWVAWQQPRRAALRDRVVRHTLAEAAWVGVTGRGVMSRAGSQLLDGADAAAMLAPLLPHPVDMVVLQADLTAVAPGPLERALAASLAVMADVESRGGATVYRFSAASLRRALDAGWPASQLHTFLAQHSRTPVPQPLTYLVDDSARRHGRLRVSTGGTFLRSDDPAEIDALVADHGLGALRLRRVAPTVAVSELSADDVVHLLREAGHAPVVETPDGSPALPRANQRRARLRPPFRATRLTLTPDEAEVVVAAIRAGEQAAAHRPAEGIARRSASALDMLAALREAAQSAGSVWLSYVDRTGTHSERVVDPLRVDAGWLTAHDHRTDRTRTFALHRIRQVAPLQPP